MMNIREEIELRENTFLSENAARSSETRGRLQEEESDEMRTEYQRDRDRIVHSKSFRRLMHKTQVFLSPEGDHFRTRLTHTIEVSQISRTIARALNLNEDLTEAISLGHDLGHTPFGHNGERVLDMVHEGGFRHNEQSLRIVDLLEEHNDKRGMNLTFEVRDGILNHTGPVRPVTLEGQIVKISDRIAYINHDIDDAIRSGVISLSDLPSDCIAYFGKTHGERIDRMVKDVIYSSREESLILMSEESQDLMNELRAYMFKHVYHSDKVKKHEQIVALENVIRSLYGYYLDHPSEMPKDYEELIQPYGQKEAVKDYIAGMTDRYSLIDYERIFGRKEK